MSACKRPRVAIVKQRGICGSRPTFEDSRMEPRVFWSFFEAGWSNRRIIEEGYPDQPIERIRFSRELYESARRFFERPAHGKWRKRR